MKDTLTLAGWLTAPRPADTPIAWLDDHTWTLGHLRHDVAQLMAHLQQQPGARWALCFENSYLFIVALLATLYAGKTPLMPGHCRVSLLNEQRGLFDGVLSDKTLGWQGPLLVVSSSKSIGEGAFIFPPVSEDACVELFTSGSTGQPKRIVKPVACLDREAGLLAARFAGRLTGCRVVASVVPQHLYGLTFRIFLPMALGLPLHAAMLWYAEQLAALDHELRYAFISSPAFLKRLDHRLTPPPVTMILSAGGMLSWQEVTQAAAWLNVWPDEIYGSTETGILAWRYRQQDSVSWLPFPGVRFEPEGGNFRVFSPLIADVNGLLLDDILRFGENGRFRLLGRRGRVVKIEEKRISLSEVEQRLLALEGIRDVAALPVTRGGRQGVGVLLVLDGDAQRQWRHRGGKAQELAWRRALLPWLEPVAIPRYWRVIDEIPVNSMNKRVYAQLQELFHETP
ncbi:AMP-binding protein [Citrobacter rodentium]|uniref:AMP-binding protein n=2 Tax=Citrobacter rodentium TaxID=67825 RepID=D2TKR8_CITRI|nr:AMP-binding protein [Citrobacter rodentium]KIQ50626.1 AMP-dependent synthetase [Citrobacter rodentium]QBY30610.1 acyl-CoA synthetase [Citrobacter rodentium]UHO32020.1 AMP-binding protein [Citrobacter rodentium NBRC 105723 = DSM 16636]CBG91032.1 putative AMP-binding protein [Citrobacter rodentium ICC168]HAT8011340.1 AMP-dependent synthetase [Citrobacter rodentium NBRC 105723 = DSM 16636]